MASFGTNLELYLSENEQPRRAIMKFLDKWQAYWMAISFAEAGEQDTAVEIYETTQERPAERVTERKRPRPRNYRT
jgi:hypothetical protein